MKNTSHNRPSENLDSASETQQQGDPVQDPMSDVLDTIRLRGAVFFLWEPSWPYGIGVVEGTILSRYLLPRTDTTVSFHIVTKGPCWGAVEGEEPIRLDTGDTLVLPRGDAYKIANEPLYPTAEDKASSIEFFQQMACGEHPSVIRGGGPGPKRSGLICGFLSADMRPFNPLLSTLPRIMRVPAPDDGQDPLSSLIAYALSESRKNQGGERCLLLRLSEVMFVEVLRRYLRNAPTSNSGWLDGLRDPIVGNALSLMHKHVSESWTIEKLANAIGTSRSTLSEKFTKLVGEPPMQYLTNWRIQIAANRLSDKSAKLFGIAHEIGYESESAFSRAFKRVTGQTPNQWRKQRSNIN